MDELTIGMDKIIGGENNCGHGWNMLMECLAAGRGICLPATALASSKTATYGIFNYAKHRKQFKIPLIQMQGVQEKMVDMLYHTWLIQCSVDLTNTILDSGEKPAVISAMMKQQTTERARKVLSDGMDIHAGSSICLGDNNFLEKFYRSAPIGITVEGSNILTRHLIIFGQGLNKSHPHIYPILNDILHDDVEGFRKHFKNMIVHALEMMCKSLIPNFSHNVKDRLAKQTIHFAHLSNIVALKGGRIKKEQFLSGDMADFFSNLYLAYSVLWEYDNNQTSKTLSEYCIHRLMNDNQIIMNRIVDNDKGFNKVSILHLKGTISNESYIEKEQLIDEMIQNESIIEKIKEDIYIEGTILEELEQLNELSVETDEYKTLYDKVIQVGEYPIVNTEK